MYAITNDYLLLSIFVSRCFRFGKDANIKDIEDGPKCLRHMLQLLEEYVILPRWFSAQTVPKF
jgi:hypothetical protein